MGRKKDFSTATSSNPNKRLRSKISPPTNINQNIIYFEDGATNTKKFDFTPFFGKGYDSIVESCRKSIIMLNEHCSATNGGTRSPASLATYCNALESAFFPFCEETSKLKNLELDTESIDKNLINLYIKHISRKGASYSTQKNIYTHTKSTLIQLVKQGKIPKDTFPYNPYPRSNKSKKGETAYSKKENSQLLYALKTEIKKIKESPGLILSNDLAYCALGIAVRTGINTTPAIELPIDCLIPHPLLPERNLLVTSKRRSRKITPQPQGATKSNNPSPVTADVEEIINCVKTRNDEIRRLSKWPNRLFVTQNGLKKNSIHPVKLDTNKLTHALTVLVKKYSLTSDNGEPLRINFMKIRKTFTNKIWEISGGDPFITAALAGNTPSVLNDSYLEPPPDAEKKWALMGEIRNRELSKTQAIIATDKTPIASCADPINGHRAPKNGTYCVDFIKCFQCRSFVITTDDLYRLFSFYWLLIRERGRINTKKWKSLYRKIIDIIDNQISPKFDIKTVTAMKTKSKDEPHPFWKDPTVLEI